MHCKNTMCSCNAVSGISLPLSPSVALPPSLPLTLSLSVSVSVSLSLSVSVSFSLSKYIYMVFTTEGFLEVAIKGWPEWDLNHEH